MCRLLAVGWRGVIYCTLHRAQAPVTVADRGVLLQCSVCEGPEEGGIGTVSVASRHRVTLSVIGRSDDVSVSQDAARCV